MALGLGKLGGLTRRFAYSVFRSPMTQYGIRKTRCGLLLTGVFLYIGADKFLKQGQDFAGFGMTAHLFLGEEHLAIYFDVKNPFHACHQGKIVNDVLVILEQIGRRPDGSIAVVSRYTVG
jgi:hypothetical protein